MVILRLCAFIRSCNERSDTNTSTIIINFISFLSVNIHEQLRSWSNQTPHSSSERAHLIAV